MTYTPSQDESSFLETVGDGSDSTGDAPAEGVFEPVQKDESAPPPYFGKGRETPPGKPAPKPMRFVFGDMAGAVFLVWIPVVAAFFLPWREFGLDIELYGSLTVMHLCVAGLIALPPFIVLTIHLAKGRLWDGIMDMFLWAIWECIVMILLCFLYPERGADIIWHASDYWVEMRGWLATGEGIEGDPLQWYQVHLLHLGLLIVGAIIFGLPALILGVLQLNYMNYYVARCCLLSDNALPTAFVAWHFWSIFRVAGYIMIAASFYYLVLRMFRIRWSGTSFAGGLVFGLILVIADAFLKWQFAEQVRVILADYCGL